MKVAHKMQDAKIVAMQYSQGPIRVNIRLWYGAQRFYSHRGHVPQNSDAWWRKGVELGVKSALHSRHQWRHSIPRGDDAILPDLEEAEEVVKVAHPSIHRRLQRMYRWQEVKRGQARAIASSYCFVQPLQRLN